MTNLFSDVWLEKLRTLEDSVPPQPLDVVFQTIKEDTGKDPHELFKSFSEEPLGSASIGQVHHAVLHDGSTVAVKVQYPTASFLFRSDMAAIRGFMELAVPEQVIILDELERSFEDEFNYEQEARNLVEVAQNVASSPYRDQVVVPLPRQELCSRRVLVMDYLQGPKLRDGVMAYAAEHAKSLGITVEQLEADMKAKFERGEIEGRYSGPSSTQVALYRGAIQGRDWICNAGIATYNTMLGWMFGRVGYFKSVLPPNAPR